jgi:hypothetical protein
MTGAIRLHLVEGLDEVAEGGMFDGGRPIHSQPGAQ